MRDSNPRSRKTADLQSAPFVHSGNCHHWVSGICTHDLWIMSPSRWLLLYHPACMAGFAPATSYPFQFGALLLCYMPISARYRTGHLATTRSAFNRSHATCSRTFTSPRNENTFPLEYHMDVLMSTFTFWP